MEIQKWSTKFKLLYVATTTTAPQHITTYDNQQQQQQQQQNKKKNTKKFTVFVRRRLEFNEAPKTVWNFPILEIEKKIYESKLYHDYSYKTIFNVRHFTIFIKIVN